MVGDIEQLRVASAGCAVHIGDAVSECVEELGEDDHGIMVAPLAAISVESNTLLDAGAGSTITRVMLMRITSPRTS